MDQTGTKTLNKHFAAAKVTSKKSFMSLTPESDLHLSLQVRLLVYFETLSACPSFLLVEYQGCIDGRWPEKLRIVACI